MDGCLQRRRLDAKLVELVFQLPEVVAFVMAQCRAQVGGRVVLELLVGTPQ